MTHKLLHLTPTTISIQHSESEFLSSQINAGRAPAAPGGKAFALSRNAENKSDALPV